MRYNISLFLNGLRSRITIHEINWWKLYPNYTTFECNPTLSLEKIHHCHLPSSSLGFLWKCHLCSLSGVKLQWKEDFHTQLLMNSLVWVFCLNYHRSKSLHTQNHFCLNKTPTFYVITLKSFTLCKNLLQKRHFLP